MARLDADGIQQALAGIEGWELDGDAITKQLDRGDFAGSVALVDRIAPIAEEMNHHPDLAISWSKVTVTISTHSEGGLTAADFELAGRIDALS
ncbi:MAG: 4a-hydroxytetrahydrobiopterin dehydratase [Thermoleophilaceae bacterium]